MSNDQISELSEELKEWVVNIEAQLCKQFPDIPTQSLQPSTNSNSEEKPSIFCSLPNLIDTGFHSKTTAWHFVAFMRRWFGLDIPSYLVHIQEKENLLWGYYQGLGDHNIPSYIVYRALHRKDFLELLLFNSCIIIFAILSFQNVRNGIEILTGTKEKWCDPREQRSKEFYILYQNIMKDSRSVKCGMLHMKCQIPWFVVDDVYTKHSELSKKVGTPINILAFSCFDDLYPGVHKSKVHGGTVTLPPGGFKHLLHIFHWTRTPQGKYLVETGSLQPIKNMDSFYIPSATDLQLSATLLEKHAVIHVSYNDRRLSGVMQIAPWHIFKYSNQLYKDLLRFERGYMNCGFPVTAYVACIVCLLQTEADVRLLRANGIVPSTGNDEKAVLSFVHEFKTVLSDDVHMPNDLNILLEKVRAHHERRFSRNYAEFKSNYCPNPWITISVVAAVCLFVLTFIQTIYGTLSYYKQ